MPKNTFADNSSQSADTYVNKKGINELFEAMMTALMIHKPDDHITFIRKCLDKVDDNQNPIRWDHFVTKSSSKILLHQKRSKPLPPIVHTKPIIFILSSSGSLKLCSRLLERYHQVNYLSINNIANIDEDEPIDLEQYGHRYESIQNAIEQHRTQANGFLIAGEFDEQNFLHQWQRKLGRIDLIFILSFDTHQIIQNQNFRIVQIDLNNDFEDILTSTIHHFDELFPQDAFVSQRSPMISIKTNHFNLPILFCIDNHHHQSIKNNHLLIDNEFELSHGEEENNNSFIYTLCQRLTEQFSFRHIHYKDIWNFEELKNEINESMSTCSGYIIDHFPTSFNDLKRFQSEIGPCSVLIYIGDHRTVVTKSDEINRIIEKFKENKKAIYVDCQMEVDEIYDDLKSEILQHL